MFAGSGLVEPDEKVPEIDLDRIELLVRSPWLSEMVGNSLGFNAIKARWTVKNCR